ncbi:MAG: efflux RND transporter periplasmic adaptor subunit [Holophaga sp.]|nr:efflux RND transporter periplasmic adaptor subunit [Holophaga sp.]
MFPSLIQRPWPALACLGAALVLGVSCHHAKPAAAPPLQVEVTGAIQQDVPLVHEWIGTVDGFVNAEIRPQVEGYVVKQTYREGFPVKRGQLLFQIDSRQFQAAANEAKAAMARDQAFLDKAKLDVDRYAPLAAQKAISQQELDNALAARSQAKATLDATRATYDKVKLNLDWTRIVSPIDGIAGMAKAQVGDLVTGQTIMTTVSTVDPVKVFFSASEAEYMSWAQSWSAKGGGKGSLQLLLSDKSLYPHKGDPFMTDRNVDLKTGTIMLAGVFPNPDHLLRPGQFAKVRAVLGVQKNAIMVPLRSVWEVQGRPQVAVVGPDNRVDIRPVTTGPIVGPLVAIQQGLQAADRVVVEGVQKVTPGLLVKPVSATR